jgi:hypothetical protein
MFRSIWLIILSEVLVPGQWAQHVRGALVGTVWKGYGRAGTDLSPQEGQNGPGGVLVGVWG